MNGGPKGSAIRGVGKEEQVAIYTLGRIEELIAVTARSHQISESILAHRLAEMLYSQEVREPLGAQDRLPAMRGEAANGRGQPLEPVEMVDRAPRGSRTVGTLEQVGELGEQGFSPEEIRQKLGLTASTVITYLGRARKLGYRIEKSQGNKGFSYAGTHWTQLARNKKRLRAQMQKTRAVAMAKLELSKRQQQVYKLRQQGQTYTEIAKKLKIAPGSVATHMHVAKAKMGEK